MLARERQRIGAQGTHEVFLAELLEPTLVHMLVAYTIYDILLYTYIVLSLNSYTPTVLR